MMEPARLTPEVLAAAAARADEEEALAAPQGTRAPSGAMADDLPPLPRVTSPRPGSNSPRAPPARKTNYGSIQPLNTPEFSRRDDSDLEGSEADGPEGGGGSTVSEEFTSYDRARLQLYRKVPVKAGLINPYRFLVVLRLLVMLGFFFWRITNPNNKAFGLWMTAVICEIWIGLAWVVDQAPKLSPVNRETFMDRLTQKYDRENEDSKLQAVDFVINSADPDSDSPVLTCNAALSVLALDYPVNKVSCYVNDEGASMLTFQVLTETASFARDWVPFCKKFDIEPRAPENYFAIKVDYTKDKKHPDFVKERRLMKHHYEEFRVRINALVAKCTKQKPLEGWRVADGTPWPGNNPGDHPGMIQILLQPNVNALDNENNMLPRLVYISREKRPGYDPHRKAGAMNALLRASALITNAPYICFMDCDTYVNNSNGIKEAMCFFEDPQKGSKVSYVQFPLRYDGVDPHDRYNNHNTAFYDIYLKGLDGIQGPTFLGNGTVFRRVSLYGALPPALDKRTKVKRGCLSLCCSCFGCCGPSRPSKTSEMDLEEQEHEELQLMPFKWKQARFGTCENFVSSTFETNGGAPVNSPRTTLSDVILVISCGYEENTQWGKEIGWMYCSSAEHVVTGQKVHARGWRSVYCLPKRPAFRRPAAINLADRLHAVLQESLGAVETYWSKYNPLWWRVCSSHQLKRRQRLAYLNAAAYPMVAIPVSAYCILPAICLITNQFIVGHVTNVGAGIFVAYALVYGLSCWFEMRWSAVPLEEWWRAQQMWVINCTSGYLAAVGQGSLRVFAGCEGALKASPHEHEDGFDYAELYTFRWTWLLITPLTVILINCFGIVAGLAKAVNNKNPDWGQLAVRLVYAVVVLTFMYPFAKGLMGRHRRVPTIVIVWCLMLAIIFSLLWVQVLF